MKYILTVCQQNPTLSIVFSPQTQVPYVSHRRKLLADQSSKGHRRRRPQPLPKLQRHIPPLPVPHTSSLNPF